MVILVSCNSLAELDRVRLIGQKQICPVIYLKSDVAELFAEPVWREDE